jgi:hypothetical protein
VVERLVLGLINESRGGMLGKFAINSKIAA